MENDPAPMFDKAAAWTSGVFAGVTEDQHDGTTPCTEWNVRELMGHLIGANHFFAGTANGTWENPPEGAEPPDMVGDDPAAAYRASVAAVQEAFADKSRYGQMFDVPAGEMPGGQLLFIAMTEQLLHGWDLAKATGQDTTLDPELAATVDTMLRPNIAGAVEGGFYGPAVQVPDDASAGDKLVALVGRKP